MTATEIATALLPALRTQGFTAIPHLDPIPNGYGHKITLFEQAGPALGTLVIYAGKQGPRYTTNELRMLTPTIQARLAQAWTNLNPLRGTPTEPQPSTPVPSPESHSEGIELWVDGACLQESTGLRFGWACVIRAQGQEVYRHSSSHIPDYSVEHRNVAAELQAVVHGLEQCRLRGYSSVSVYYDYTGIAEWATGRWRAKTRTTQEYAAYVRDYPLPISWQKVAAHTGVPMNELVDSLATSAARSATLHSVSSGS